MKSPEKLFSISMWLVSLLFASFLIGLGGKIISDLPSTTTSQNIDDFLDRTAINGHRSTLKHAQDDLVKIQLRYNEATQEYATQSHAYQSATTAHQNWLATRNATSNNPKAQAQDPELIKQTTELDQLSATKRNAQTQVEAVERDKLTAERNIQEAQTAIHHLTEQAQPAFDRYLHGRELKIFGMRLLLTLPLLGLGGWLVIKQRQSTKWPLYRGFVIFSIFTFFFELVPYLPSYGGYVRYVVGLLFVGLTGHYGIKWMQAYLIRRQAEALRNEQDRRATLNNITAIQKMDAGLCPGCDRKIPAPIDGVKVNNCVYCGLKLFNLCEQPVTGTYSMCGVRKNAFYKHCPSCGGEALETMHSDNTST